MADPNVAHIVEIPVDEEHKQRLSYSCTDLSPFTAIQHHPLMEISESPGHLLLLKLWQREEDLFGRRIAHKETRIGSIKTETFHLCCFFLLFHGFFFTLLFVASVGPRAGEGCRKWWVSGLMSGLTSGAIASLVQVKVYRYWKLWKQVQRQRSENRALKRCVQELRMKGSSFDLSKEPQIGKRMKSSSVEIKWKPLNWCSHYLVTICLVGFSALAFPSCKLLLCGL